MNKTHDYIDNTLIKLKRTYSKDEVVSALIKQISERDIEVGKLKAEIDHLNNELEDKVNTNEINMLARIEARKDELYCIQLEKNVKNGKRIKELTNTRNDLIGQINKLK